MKTCIVFGATGFIGRHLVRELLDEGYKVVAFGNRKKIQDEYLYENKSFQYIQGNFLNENDIQEAVRGCNYVFHFISLTTPASSDNNPFIDIDTNIRMSLILFKACVENGVERVIYASSGGAIYGNNTDTGSHREEDCPYPMSPYAIGKLTVENYLRYFKIKHGLQSVSLRISNVYGEGQESTGGKYGVVTSFLNQVAGGSEVNIFGDGSMVRDYIYIKDLISIIIKVHKRKTVEHEIYNVGSGQGATVEEVLATVESVVGKTVVRRYLPKPKSFVDTVVLNCDRLDAEFGHIKLHSLREGIAQTWRYESS